MALTTQYLSSVRNFVTALDGDGLRESLQVEPGPGTQKYALLRQELRQSFGDKSDALERIIENCLPEVDEPPEGTGSTWPGFISFIKDYLLYWRDADFDDLSGLQESLSSLLTYVAPRKALPSKLG